MKTLDEIAIANQTDKATVFTRTYAHPKGYTIHYERCFQQLRDEPIKLLEIGVGGGESIRTWLQWFSQAQVFGLDNIQRTNEWNEPGKLKCDNRYRFVHGDQGDRTMWACFLADYPGPFDVIIDDGSHEPKGIITSFECLWPRLADGGHYCIEDLGCGFSSPGFPSHQEWLQGIITIMSSGVSAFDSIYLSPELAIIRKK